MKIQAINNTNFQGKFTDNSSNNNGNWRMEYRPYSWEVNRHGEFKMTPQKELDLLAKKLPDNEKTYTYIESKPVYGSPIPQREFCRDILGTEFYFADFVNKNIRKNITEMPAMNREESLKVLDTKLDKFLQLKEKLKSGIVKNFDEIKDDIIENDNNYKSNSAIAKTGWTQRTYNKEHYRDLCNISHEEMAEKAMELYSEAKKYATLVDSIESVKELKKSGLKEIALLENAGEKGLLIDISRRDIYDPNKALWDALQDVKNAVGKFVVLPHKTIPVKEILNKIEPSTENIPQKAIQIVDEMIKKFSLMKRI